MSLIVEWLESLHEEMKVSSNCVRLRNRKSTCNDCLEKCEQEAMKVEEGLVVINTNHCTLCGECMITCPTSAIEGLAANRRFEKGSLVFDETYTPAVKELLIYKKRGLTSIKVGNKLNQEWEYVLKETNDQLNLLGENRLVVTKNDVNNLSRRALFKSFHHQGKQLAKSMTPAAWKIESKGWILSEYYPDFQFYSVEMNTIQCTLCQACFSLCPQEVFSLRDFNLNIDNAKCVNCRSCTDVCPEGAIQIEKEIMKKRENGKNVHHYVCTICGHTFYSFHSDATSCAICRNRDPEWLSPY